MTAAYFSPEQLKRINDDPALLSLLYDLNLLPEQVIARVRHAAHEERERCAKTAESMKLTGGAPGVSPARKLFDAGWNDCAAHTAQRIRATGGPDRAK